MFINNLLDTNELFDKRTVKLSCFYLIKAVILKKQTLVSMGLIREKIWLSIAI